MTICSSWASEDAFEDDDVAFDWPGIENAEPGFELEPTDGGPGVMEDGGGIGEPAGGVAGGLLGEFIGRGVDGPEPDGGAEEDG